MQTQTMNSTGQTSDWRNFSMKHQYWGSRLTSYEGRDLYNTMLENKLEILSTGEQTYWPTDINKIPDLLDFLIHKGRSRNY
jgi:hypothetical protein